MAMDVRQKAVTVRELARDYADDGEFGVLGYGGRLDIRPPYQRAFVYQGKREHLKHKVIETASRGLPLNVMYWAEREDGSYEVIDGQQRTISLCEYVNGDFASRWEGRGVVRYFNGLPPDLRKRLLDYKLTVYVCKGTDSEKHDWFETINVAGVVLNPQELLNAVHAGQWLADAKGWFSQTNCPASQMAGQYLKGVAIEQDLLRTALKWAAAEAGETIGEYMARHQGETSARALWLSFRDVIDWVQDTFPNYRPAMKGVDWGWLNREHRGKRLDPAALEVRVSELVADYDVTDAKGIYAYVLDGNERHLNIRRFNKRQAQRAYERQEGVCPICKDSFAIGDMEADHKRPWSKGGKTEDDNCQMLCTPCNIEKGAR